MPLVVEPLWYPLEGETWRTRRRARRGTTRWCARPATFAELGADIIKVEFPGYVGTERGRRGRACAGLDAGVDVPWVLLSASATYEQFEQLRIAAAAGACGFMAGRAIWGDAVGPLPRRRAGRRRAHRRRPR